MACGKLGGSLSKSKHALANAMCNVQRPKSEHRMHKKKLNNKKKHTHTNVHTESNEILNTRKKEYYTQKQKARNKNREFNNKNTYAPYCR